MVLRGQAFGWDNWWPQYYNAAVVRWLRDDWCVDVVRPAMGIEPEGAYLSNPAASKQRMMAVVDAAIDAGIYVIIDWHAHDLHQAEAIAFFSEMAQRYGKRTNTAFAGIVAGPNKVMRRVARRDLITWDPDARGYRMDPADAEIVLERWLGS